ncbi:hypothetical protein [Chitinivorax sp. B]|uniref:hypothetical protein n=1 Tax=Chitinivorax sp. B TaxID=2502235 RepID=UPI0010F8FBB5|nr:hypothetical protein [Chitinivorax sp. B]
MGEALGNVTVRLQEALSPFFSNKEYGGEVDQFMLVVVAVDSDVEENKRSCKAYNRVASYKDMITGSKVKFLGIALPFDPIPLAEMSERELANLICIALQEKMNNPELKIPKGFDYQLFKNDLQLALELYKCAI